jgi:adenylate kinase family enzyme
METFFNLENPVEKKLYERLIKYVDMNMSADEILVRLGRDYPFIPDNLRDQCESAVFNYFEVSGEHEMTAEFKMMNLLHSSRVDEPFYSHRGTTFRISGDEDVHISIMAENRHFLFRDAIVHYSIYVNDVMVNMVHERMTDMERRSVYTVPLKLKENGLLENGIRNKLNIKVVDEQIKGREHTKDIEVICGDVSAGEVYDMYYKSLRYVHDVEDLDMYEDEYRNWLEFEAKFLYSEKPYGEFFEDHALVELTSKDSGSQALSYKYLIHILERYDCPGDLFIERKIPVDTLDPGEYEFKLYIWNDLVWSTDVYIGEQEEEETTEEETEEEDDFDKLLDDFIKSVLDSSEIDAFIQFQFLDDENNIVSVEAGGFIRILKEPAKIRARILFDTGWENKEDIQIMIRAMGWNYPIHFTITGEEFNQAECKAFERDFPLAERELENFRLLYMEMKTADGSNSKSFDYTVVRFDSPHEVLDLQSLRLYDIHPTSDGYSPNEPSKTGFDSEKLKTLSAYCRFANVHNLNFAKTPTEMVWNLYTETGVLLESVDSQFRYTETIDAFAKFGEFNDRLWEKGLYRLELTWFDETMFSAMFKVGDHDITNEYDPIVIRRKTETIPATEGLSALERLDRMAGLEDIKKKVHSFVNYTKLQQKRKEAGLPTRQPALHARFLGNPGTGKTTVAKLLGQIYKELGLLSSGHVVVEERKNFMGRYYDTEVETVNNALSRAKGGILLIDEAYNLYVENDEKDPGRRVLEYLLTALSDENNRDWMLILAGYPKEMERMLDSNPGLKSRVSDEFTFKDYDVDTLMAIAEIYCQDNSYILSEEGRETLRAAITFEYEHKDKHFGNGRYVNKLMEKIISTNMATRISAIESPTEEQLMTIEAEDIVIDDEMATRIAGQFDDKAIDEALKRLDSLVGLNKVKSAIHNFVNVARYLNSNGERFTGKGLLKWNFTGSTGTGKSTVAQILADILKAMNLILSNDMKEIKGEEIFNVSEYTCNEVLKEAVKKHQKGMLHIDADAPEFRSREYRMTNEMIRIKLTNLILEENSTGALIISECSSPKQSIAYSLANNGVYDYDHIIIFDDYTEEELYQILLQCLEKYGLTMSEEAECSLKEYIRNLCSNRELSFANARTMKTLSRAIYEIVLLRISKEKQPSDERIILGCDVESFVWKKVGSNKIGF